MSPMLLLTYVHCGGLTVHILSTHVGQSLISQQQPKHPSPLTWDSKAVSRAMTPDRESHWTRRMLHKGRLWWSSNANNAAQQQWRALIDGSRITGEKKSIMWDRNRTKTGSVEYEKTGTWIILKMKQERLTKTKTMDLFCRAGAKITSY